MKSVIMNVFGWVINAGDISSLPPLERLSRQIFNFDCLVGLFLSLGATIFFLPNDLFGENGYSLFLAVFSGVFYAGSIWVASKGYYLPTVYVNLAAFYVLVATIPLHTKAWFEPLFLVPIGINAFLYLPNKGKLARIIFSLFAISGAFFFFAFLDLEALASTSIETLRPALIYGVSTLTFLIIGKMVALLILYQQTIKANEENEFRYQNLFENTYDGITLINDISTITDANKAARKLLGMKKGQKVFLPSMIHPDYLETYQKFLAKQQEEGFYSGLQTRIINLKGETRDIEINSVGIKDKHDHIIGSLDIFRDITENKKVVEALKESEKRFRRIFQVSAVGIVIIDMADWSMMLKNLRKEGMTDLRLLLKKNPEFLFSIYAKIKPQQCNQAFLEMVGASSMEELKKNIGKILQQDFVKEIIREAHAIMNGESHFEGELEIQPLNGPRRTVLYSVIYPPETEMNQAVYAIMDITAQKKVEQELEHHVEELTKANEELDSFVYKVAHDLRAPLTNVMGLINLAVDDEEVKGASTYLSLQKKSVERMDAFMRDIVDFTRNVRQEVSQVSVDLPQLVDEVLALQQETILGEKLKIYKEIDAAPFYSDPMRIRIILNNLISNAVRYSDPQKEESFVRIHAEIADEKCILVVEDNGKGIHEKYLEKVFHMFFRGDSKTNGSGLGLYIVKEMVEKLEAEVILESEWKVFTRFTIVFPNNEINKEDSKGLMEIKNG
jgi:PAS domain S-box-containing protein